MGLAGTAGDKHIPLDWPGKLTEPELQCFLLVSGWLAGLNVQDERHFKRRPVKNAPVFWLTQLLGFMWLSNSRDWRSNWDPRWLLTREIRKHGWLLTWRMNPCLFYPFLILGIDLNVKTWPWCDLSTCDLLPALGLQIGTVQDAVVKTECRSIQM